MLQSPSIIDNYKTYCERLKVSRDYRKLQIFDGDFLDFSTNDYLNLSKNRAMLQAAYEAGAKYGCGATGSRLLSGNKKIFEEFETRIAKDKHTEAALIFCSGYQANFTVLSALCEENILNSKNAVLFFDKLNHASLYKAALLSKVKLERYRHKDINMLDGLLKKYDSSQYVKFIVSETVFGMDGDIADLTHLISLAHKYNAILYLDEAHATGVFGPNGYGLSTEYDLSDVECVIMGTFSKALGVSGAYIACSNTVKDYLVQRCSGFIYSTAVSPIIIGAVQKGWELVGNMHEERKKLLLLSDYCRERLKKYALFAYDNNLKQRCCFDTMQSCTNIIPIRMQSGFEAIRYKKYLLNEKVLVSAIRRPTVSIPRIRLAITLAHTEKHIDYLCECLGAAVK